MIIILLGIIKKRFAKEKEMAETTKYYEAKGTVQNVMFRQTFIRGAQKRSLKAGATNDSRDMDRVIFILQGEEAQVNQYVDFLKDKKVINSWGATIEKMTRIETEAPLSSFQVTTENVDQFNWNPDVEMYV
jgi:acylphosphatase